MNRQIKRLFYTIGGLIPPYLLSHWRGRAVVLVYHRVLPDDEVVADQNPSGMSVSCGLFKAQMHELTSNYRVVNMDELRDHLLSDSQDFVVAVTLDDGYRDNLQNALPILEFHGVPATIYVTTRFPEGDTGIWWFEIWDHILKEDRVQVSFKEQNKEWVTTSLPEKYQCYNELSALLLPLAHDDKKALLSEFTGTAERKQYPKLCLSWDEVKELDQHDLLTIGAHTHSHPNLNSLDTETAYFELNHSKYLLEQHLGHLVDHFAYPFGGVCEANIREFNMAEQCGFRTAATTRFALLNTSNLYAIPRVAVTQSVSARGLRGKLSGWEHWARQTANSLQGR